MSSRPVFTGMSISTIKMSAFARLMTSAAASGLEQVVTFAQIKQRHLMRIDLALYWRSGFLDAPDGTRSNTLGRGRPLHFHCSSDLIYGFGGQYRKF